MFNAQNRIRQLMVERGWTIYRLAQESGLSQTTISNIFKRNNQPSLPTVNKASPTANPCEPERKAMWTAQRINDHAGTAPNIR